MDWIHHFTTGPPVRLDKYGGDQISEEERGRIAYSIAQFQRGEASEAKDYLGKCRDFAAETDDPRFLAESRLFVAEENFHSRLMAEFMVRSGIDEAAGSWADDVFRRVRSFGDIAWSSRVLLVAEILAQVYFPALHEATSSPMLRAICGRIIEDEDHHIGFQAERIAAVLARRGRLLRLLHAILGFFLLCGTTMVLWIGHHAVLAHSLSFVQYVKTSFRRYHFAMERIRENLERRTPAIGDGDPQRRRTEEMWRHL